MISVRDFVPKINDRFVTVRESIGFLIGDCDVVSTINDQFIRCMYDIQQQ